MTDIKKKLNLARATIQVKQELQPVNLVEMFQQRGIDLTGSDNNI